MSDLFSAVEDGTNYLDGVITALRFLGSQMEEEGYPKSTDSKEMERVRAICLVNRMPAFISVFGVILRDLERIADNLNEAFDEEHEKRKAERAT